MAPAPVAQASFIKLVDIMDGRCQHGGRLCTRRYFYLSCHLIRREETPFLFPIMTVQ